MLSAAISQVTSLISGRSAVFTPFRVIPGLNEIQLPSVPSIGVYGIDTFFNSTVGKSPVVLKGFPAPSEHIEK